MAHTFREHNPDQVYLFPPSPSDWLAKDHKAYFVRDIVKLLDMDDFFRVYSQDGRGAPAFSPALLLSIIVYGWMRGVYSCRKLAQLCRDDVGGRYLVGVEQPDFRSINRFRIRHAAAIEKLFLQSVHLCLAAKMVTVSDVAIDGTRISSYGSKRKNIHYGDIAGEEARHIKFLREANARADAEDAADDAKFGSEQECDPVPEAMKTSEGRLKVLREAKAALEAEAKIQAEAKLSKWQRSDPSDRPHYKKPEPETSIPAEAAQYNPTDPESRVQFSCQGGYLQGYNGQIAVDAKSQVIVAVDLSNSATDVGFLVPMIDQVVANTAITPEHILADSGYYSAANVVETEARNATALIPPPLKKNERSRQQTEHLAAEPASAQTTKSKMLHAISQPESKAIYKMRRQSVEPVFGQLKGSPGHSRFRRFTRLTLDKCRLDWILLCTVHNFSKYMTLKAD
jgi:transposase